jgi:hypothetical protein
VSLMTTKEMMTRQLYEDAVLLHRIHTEHAVRRDRFLNYWLDRDCFK